MLYQLSHVRMPVRGYLGPVRRISPALRQNFIRSSPNHQLKAGVDGKNLPHESRRATLFPVLSQVRWRVTGTNRPFGMIIRGIGADARLPRRSPRRGQGHDKPGYDGSPRRRRKRIGRGRLRSHGDDAGGLSLGGSPGPLRGPGPGSWGALPRGHCALRIRSASSVSTSTWSVSSPAGTSA
jgi:hypothetical protein